MARTCFGESTVPCKVFISHYDNRPESLKGRREAGVTAPQRLYRYVFRRRDIDDGETPSYQPRRKYGAFSVVDQMGEAH